MIGFFKRRQIHYPAIAISHEHKHRPATIQCKNSWHSSTGQWQRSLSLSTFSAQGFIMKTNHVPYAISTTTIKCEKVFSNLIPAHLEQHRLEGHRRLPFRYLCTQSLSPSLIHPVTSAISTVPVVSQSFQNLLPHCSLFSEAPQLAS